MPFQNNIFRGVVALGALGLFGSLFVFAVHQTTPSPHVLLDGNHNQNQEASTTPPLVNYVEIVQSCGIHFEGTCVVARSGPGTEFPIVNRFRTGTVLMVSTSTAREGHTWYKIAFANGLRYPERVTSDWYVAGDYAHLFQSTGTLTLPETAATSTTKRIVVDRTKQMLYAYDGNDLFMEAKISTGVELTPTPRGLFRIYKKTPSRYMQGPIPGISTEYYDLPGVPWNLYFTYQGAVIHGAYWHNDFGKVHSNGCVNLPITDAAKLYQWADLGTEVLVRD